MNLTEADRQWLAGYLEGEGSFLRPTPSSPNRCIVQVAATDEDVIARVAAMWGQTYHRSDPKPGIWKPNYRVQIRGHAAAALMEQLRPLMGERRRQQIDAAMAGQAPRGPHPNQRLTDAQVTAIRSRRGERARTLAHEYGVSRSLVYHLWEGTRRPVAQQQSDAFTPRV